MQFIGSGRGDLKARKTTCPRFRPRDDYDQRLMAGPINAIRARLHSTGYMMSAASGPAGKAGVLRFLLANRVPALAGRNGLISVRMKALNGQPVWVRPRASDMYNAASYYAYELYLPPPEIRTTTPRTIVELGTNTGAALAALATAYPHARLIGVEPDPGNLEIARRNLERFGDRVVLERAGIWDENTHLVAEDSRGAGDHGLTVRAIRDDEEVPADATAAITVDELLDKHVPEGDVDYMHISIEGTEPRVFAAGGRWPSRVRSLRVELHDYFGFTAEQCIPQLEQLGYRAWPAPEEPSKWIYAVRA